MPEGLVEELHEVKPRGRGQAALPHRDVRARRPPFFGSILRLDLARRLTRVATLAVLDAAGIYLALLTALELKLVVRGESDIAAAWELTQDYAPLAVLVTILLFARSGLYGERAVRPGFSRIVASLFQGTVVLLIYSLAEGEDFSSYYTFYGGLFFALFYVLAFRQIFERASGVLLRAAGYRRRAVLVGRGQHIDAVAAALAQSEVKPVGSSRSSRARRTG